MRFGTRPAGVLIFMSWDVHIHTSPTESLEAENRSKSCTNSLNSVQFLIKCQIYSHENDLLTQAKKSYGIMYELLRTRRHSII